MIRAARGAGPDRGLGRLRSRRPGPAPPVGRLWLVRHGETEWSRAHRHTGRTDLPLTDRGERQAAGLALVLSGLRPALVLSSPRRRALDTARLAGFSGAVVGADLAEWEYGEYEGLTAAEIRQNTPGWTIWSGDPPPGGEAASDVALRADRVLDQIRASLVDGDVLVFGHGHFSRVLAARWLGQPASAGRMFSLGPAAPCVLGSEPDGPAMLHWNLVEPGMLTRPNRR